MADAVHNPEHEYWRAPLPSSAPESSAEDLVERCARCGTEFLVGSGFCHACGASRTTQPVVSRFSSWTRYFTWTRYLEFHAIKERLGLSTPALVAFLIGLGCVVGAVGVGFVFTANSVLDWQAVQLWRIQWLLGASASFLAGILLKSASGR